MSNNQRKGRGWTDELPQRKDLRLCTRNYSDAGCYFITICTRYQTRWLGDITNGEMRLNAAGDIVQAEWDKLPERFPGLKLDQFTVMPNHLHGILIFTEDLRYQKPAKKPRPTLNDVIDTFKGAMTHRIRREGGIADFEWKKSFYDKIIHGIPMLHAIRQYIANNPQRWLSDNLYGKDGEK